MGNIWRAQSSAKFRIDPEERKIKPPKKPPPFRNPGLFAARRFRDLICQSIFNRNGLILKIQPKRFIFKNSTSSVDFWGGAAQSSKMNCICAIGDIVGLRRLESQGKRRELQKKLAASLARLNRTKAGLVSPYTITLGDEFQAVLSDATRLFPDFWFIQYSVFPVKIRLSIGTGGLSTSINKKRAVGMDGMAFHKARNGIDELRKRGGFLRWESEEAGELRWINPALDLISNNSLSWRPKRMLVLHELLSGDVSVEEIARKINSSKTAAYKNIQAGALKPIAALSNEIGRVVNQSIR